jgi:hypothetical protein
MFHPKIESDRDIIQSMTDEVDVHMEEIMKVLEKSFKPTQLQLLKQFQVNEYKLLSQMQQMRKMTYNIVKSLQTKDKTIMDKIKLTPDITLIKRELEEGVSTNLHSILHLYSGMMPSRGPQKKGSFKLHSLMPDQVSSDDDDASPDIAKRHAKFWKNRDKFLHHERKRRDSVQGSSSAGSPFKMRQRLEKASEDEKEPNLNCERRSQGIWDGEGKLNGSSSSSGSSSGSSSSKEVSGGEESPELKKNMENDEKIDTGEKKRTNEYYKKYNSKEHPKDVTYNFPEKGRKLKKDNIHNEAENKRFYKNIERTETSLKRKESAKKTAFLNDFLRRK